MSLKMEWIGNRIYEEGTRMFAGVLKDNTTLTELTLRSIQRWVTCNNSTNTGKTICMVRPQV